MESLIFLGASVLRAWFFPAKNSLNKHLETGKLQEFLDDGNGNLKGIKMVNVRWEKIDGQMRLLDKKKYCISAWNLFVLYF